MNRPLTWIVIVLLLLAVDFGRAGADDESLLNIPGRIAYIGTDFNVYSIDLRAGHTFQLTDDATPVRRYQWPTWADNDKLAYFCCDPLHSARLSAEVYISPDGETSGEEVYRSANQIFTYAAWSPQDCTQEAGCRDLAVLLSELGVSTFSVELIRSLANETENRTVGQGAPFYYSWSPDGNRMLWHRDNDRLDMYSVAGDELDPIAETPGRFPTPAWSPVDDRLLLALADEDGLTDLAVYANGEARVLVPDLAGVVSFTWSPDGNYVAYRLFRDSRVGPLFVVDAVTGEEIMRTLDESVIAFFWSPDSSKIAYLSLATPRGSFNVSSQLEFPVRLPAQEVQGLAWSIVDMEHGGQVRTYGTFLPTTELAYLLNFFDQFAQSHSIWSPDSAHIVYSQTNADQQQVISVLDMTRPDTVPFNIAEGIIGIWSYR